MDILSKEQQRDLAVLAQKGDQAAKSTLIKKNERFVSGIARQYQGQGMDLVDLIQEGFIGLLKAIEHYNANLGVPFLNYAVWWIKQSILQSLSENNRHIRIPANRVNILEQIKSTKRKLAQELQREPTEQEVLEHMDLNINDVVQQHSVSYHLPASSEDGDDTTLLDIIPDGEVPSPDAVLMMQSFKQELQMILNKLNDREQRIIKMLYGIDHERSYTLEEVGEAFHITRERVRQIKKHAIKALKKLNRRKKLDGIKD